MGAGYSRKKQAWLEKMNRVGKSEYAPEFLLGLQELENTIVGSLMMVEKVRALGNRYWNMEKSKDGGGKVRAVQTRGGRVFPTEELASIGEELAGAASAHNHYAAHMLKLSRTQRAETVEQVTLGAALENGMITILADWLNKEAPQFRLARKNMELARLDMDRAIIEAKAIESPHHPKRIAAEARTRLHMDAMLRSQAIVDRVPQWHNEQLYALASAVFHMRAFHSKNASLLTTSLFELGVDLPFPPTSPVQELPPMAPPPA